MCFCSNTKSFNPATFNVLKRLQYIGESELKEDFSLIYLTLDNSEGENYNSFSNFINI